MSEVRQLYSDKNYCMRELSEARKIFTTKPFTVEKSNLLSKSLGLMYLYCPEELMVMVLSVMEELETRTQYII